MGSVPESGTGDDGPLPAASAGAPHFDQQYFDRHHPGLSADPLPPDRAVAVAAAHENDWKAKLHRSESGAIKSTFPSAVELIEHDPDLAGKIAFDEHSGRIMQRGTMPWGAPPGEWTDASELELRAYCAKAHGVDFKAQIVADAVRLVAERNRYHDVREVLARLHWDGEPRIDHWLGRYLDAQIPLEQLALPIAERLTLRYLKLVGSKFLIAAVARVMRPGCRADAVLILEGDQGIGKSTAIHILFHPWVSDTPLRIGDRDGYMTIRGCWCVELAELDAFNRAESSSAKAFFSSASDRYRAPYGRYIVTIPRQCVFVGSVNHGVYLRDETGNRRYWPVACGEIDLEALRRDRDQLWAEAFERYKAGESWGIEPADYSIFDAEQERRYLGDPWEPIVEAWVREQLTAFDTTSVLKSALKLEARDVQLQTQQRVGKVLARLGLTRRRHARDDVRGIRGWYYDPADLSRPDGEQAMGRPND